MILAAPSPESPDYVYHVTSGCGVIALIIIYTFGVWLRSYIFPSGENFPLKRQLLGSVPVGLITMGLYAKSVFPGLSLRSTSLTFDVIVILGYTIIFGMFSRDTLERILKHPPVAQVDLPTVGGGTPPK